MPRTVLIVDDHDGFRASARRVLEAEGYDVIAEATPKSELSVSKLELTAAPQDHRRVLAVLRYLQT